jgi:hypothetical protein
VFFHTRGDKQPFLTWLLSGKVPARPAKGGSDMSSIKIGIGFGLWRLGMPSPETICSYAERAEAVGIDSIWLSDHIVSRNPELEISCIMAMFAARTKKIKMGPSV